MLARNSLLALVASSACCLAAPSSRTKEILTLLAWLIYAVLLHERLTVGWRGRRAAWLAILGFLVLLITFVGANLWMSGYHSFSKFVQP